MALEPKHHADVVGSQPSPPSPSTPPSPPPSRKGRDLLSGPIATTLVLFALPTLASSALQSASGSLNAVWVGRFLGEAALAATANGNIVMFMLVAFVFGFGMASTILIGQAFGAGDVDRARRIVGAAVGSFLPVAAAVGALGWVFAPELLALLGTTDAVRPLALDYLRVTFVAMPAMLILTLLMMALRGAGDSVTPLWFVGLSVVLDAGLNPILITGWGPAPELGIRGSGLATALANVAALVLLVATIYARDLPLRLRGGELAYLKPDWTLLRTIVVKGVPIGLQMIVLSVSALTVLSLVNREGTAAAAAYSVALQVWTYVQMPAMALGAAASAMAAQNIGADRWDRVGRITRSGILANLALTGLLVAAVMALDDPLIGLFLEDGSAAISIARHIVAVSTWGFVAFGVAMVLFGTIRANAEVLGPLVALTLAMVPVRLGLAYGGRPWLGADAIWLSYPAAMVALMGLAIALYRWGGWRDGHLLPPGIHECLHRGRAQTEGVGTLQSPA